MGYLLEIKEEAKSDIKEAYLYYEQRKTGLGERFLETLDEFFRIIQESPNLYQLRTAPFREALIKDFPYVIVYEIESNKVIVFAVFCTWRNPNSRYNR